MCDAIALAWHVLPLELIDRRSLSRRAFDRGGEREIQFSFREREPEIPVKRDGAVEIVRWGNWRGTSRRLPRTGWAWLASVERGEWSGPELVEIPASLACESGIWYLVKRGIKGMLVPDEAGEPVCYVLCVPSTHYYRVMTRSDRMPVFLGQTI